MAALNLTDAHRTLTRATLPALLFVSACASPMGEQQCRSADWYALGYRDGDVYGIRPQIDQYARQCRSLEAAAQSAYLAGWTDGSC